MKVETVVVLFTSPLTQFSRRDRVRPPVTLQGRSSVVVVVLQLNPHKVLQVHFLLLHNIEVVVQHLVPDSNPSKNIGWIAIKFVTNIYGAQRANHNDFSSQATSRLTFDVHSAVSQ